MTFDCLVRSSALIFVGALSALATVSACGDSESSDDSSSGGSDNAQGGSGNGDGSGGTPTSSGGDTSSGGADDPGAGGSAAVGCDGMGEDACFQCQQVSCGDELEACYGEGYTGGDFSGACAELGECTLDNDCCEDPMACGTTCIPFFTDSCLSCVTELSECLETACPTECELATGAGGDGAGGAPPTDPTQACADLAECCATLPQGAAEGCVALADSNQEALCAASLDAFQQAGQCQ